MFACDVPENVGVRSSVLLSVLEEPVSDEATRSGTDGTFGLVASIVTDSALDSALVFCPLVARAVKLYVPSTSAGLTVIVHCPVPLAVVLPTTLPLASSSMNKLLPDVPVKVGVVSLVMLSVLEAPLSDKVDRSGVLGGGTGTTMFTVRPTDGELWFPASTRARAVLL